MENQIKVVYVVTSYGRIIGCYADRNEAFNVQSLRIDKGQLAELVPVPLVYPTDLKL